MGLNSNGPSISPWAVRLLGQGRGSGSGKEKWNGKNRKSEFSLLYSRVLCIIGLEKKKSGFLFSRTETL